MLTKTADTMSLLKKTTNMIVHILKKVYDTLSKDFVFCSLKLFFYPIFCRSNSLNLCPIAGNHLVDGHNWRNLRGE